MFINTSLLMQILINSFSFLLFVFGLVDFLYVWWQTAVLAVNCWSLCSCPSLSVRVLCSVPYLLVCSLKCQGFLDETESPCFFNFV